MYSPEQSTTSCSDPPEGPGTCGWKARIIKLGRIFYILVCLFVFYEKRGHYFYNISLKTTADPTEKQNKVPGTHISSISLLFIHKGLKPAAITTQNEALSAEAVVSKP